MCLREKESIIVGKGKEASNTHTILSCPLPHFCDYLSWYKGKIFFQVTAQENWEDFCCIAYTALWETTSQWWRGSCVLPVILAEPAHYLQTCQIWVDAQCWGIKPEEPSKAQVSPCNIQICLPCPFPWYLVHVAFCTCSSLIQTMTNSHACLQPSSSPWVSPKEPKWEKSLVLSQFTFSNQGQVRNLYRFQNFILESKI